MSPPRADTQIALLVLLLAIMLTRCAVHASPRLRHHQHQQRQQQQQQRQRRQEQQRNCAALPGHWRAGVGPKCGFKPLGDHLYSLVGLLSLAQSKHTMHNKYAVHSTSSLTLTSACCSGMGGHLPRRLGWCLGCHHGGRAWLEHGTGTAEPGQRHRDSRVGQRGSSQGQRQHLVHLHHLGRWALVGQESDGGTEHHRRPHSGHESPRCRLQRHP